MNNTWSLPVDVIAGRNRFIEGQNATSRLIFPNVASAKRVLDAKDAFVLAEAFMNGIFEIEGDIHDAIRIRESFYPERLSLLDKGRIIFNVARHYKFHTIRNDARFVSRHYDYPDEFFRLFLGESMTYSCAYFADNNDSLDAAQEQKIAHLLTKLQLKRGDRLLDVGCGWGALVIRAARDHGAKALGITSSVKQYEYADKLIHDLGLEKSCQVKCMDYRELEEEQQFDKVVSVGMYEHVGHKNLGIYFKKIHDLLRPDGLFVNHGITRKPAPDWRKAPEAIFIDQHIFPGGELHSPSRIMNEMERAGFEVYDVESLRKHYARTLRYWLDSLQKSSAAARKLLPERTFRAWLIYLAGCTATFEEGYFNLHQFSGSKTPAFGGREIPMTRDYLYNKSDETVLPEKTQ